jgi:predicted molibdopterin-dependent oxidoreductase YjgC
MTETAELAHVVLPGVSFAEKMAPSPTRNGASSACKAIDPIGNARPDWQIICDLSTRLGYPMDYKDTSAIMKEIASVTPSYAGITYERIDASDCSGRARAPIIRTPFLHKGGSPVVSVSFSDAVRAATEMPDDEYPFVLTTGRVLYHYHAILSRKSKGLNEIYPEGSLEMNPDDARRLGIVEETAWCRSAPGAVR